MKLKKKAKRMLVILLILLILLATGVGVLIVKKNPKKKEVEEVKIINKVDKFDYKLKENKTDTYKKMFEELKKILREDNIDEEAYAKKVTEMFIYDFYSLNDKVAKTDIGGVDFVYQGALENFLVNAQDTYYKYVESNLYNDRKQSLPVVSNIKINSVEQKEYAYGEQTDSKAYEVKVSWEYTDDEFANYQKEATVILIHDDIKLSIVELQ